MFYILIVFIIPMPKEKIRPHNKEREIILRDLMGNALIIKIKNRREIKWL